MGYHYAVNSVSYPEKVNAGDLAAVNVKLENVGVAPCYQPMQTVLRLKSDKGIFGFKQAVNNREWLPGVHDLRLRADLPASMPKGKYELQIALISPHADVVYLATDAVRDGGFYTVAEITVE